MSSSTGKEQSSRKYPSRRKRRCICHSVGSLEELPSLHAVIDKSPHSRIAKILTLVFQILFILATFLPRPVRRFLYQLVKHFDSFCFLLACYLQDSDIRSSPFFEETIAEAARPCCQQTLRTDANSRTGISSRRNTTVHNSIPVMNQLVDTSGQDLETALRAVADGHQSAAGEDTSPTSDNTPLKSILKSTPSTRRRPTGLGKQPKAANRASPEFHDVLTDLNDDWTKPQPQADAIGRSLSRRQSRTHSSLDLPRLLQRSSSELSDTSQEERMMANIRRGSFANGPAAGFYSHERLDDKGVFSASQTQRKRYFKTGKRQSSNSPSPSGSPVVQAIIEPGSNASSPLLPRQAGQGRTEDSSLDLRLKVADILSSDTGTYSEAIQSTATSPILTTAPKSNLPVPPHSSPVFSSLASEDDKVPPPSIVVDSPDPSLAESLDEARTGQIPFPPSAPIKRYSQPLLYHGNTLPSTPEKDETVSQLQNRRSSTSMSLFTPTREPTRHESLELSRQPHGSSSRRYSEEVPREKGKNKKLHSPEMVHRYSDSPSVPGASTRVVVGEVTQPAKKKGFQLKKTLRPKSKKTHSEVVIDNEHKVKKTSKKPSHNKHSSAATPIGTLLSHGRSSVKVHSNKDGATESMVSPYQLEEKAEEKAHKHWFNRQCEACRRRKIGMHASGHESKTDLTDVSTMKSGTSTPDLEDVVGRNLTFD